MTHSRWNVVERVTRFCLLTGVLLAHGAIQAGTMNVNVVGPDGLPVSGFRWLLQEDTGYQPVPGVAGDPDILSFGFHASYHPPARATDGSPLKGNTDTDSTGNIGDIADGHYYVSILPYEGYSISGAPVHIAGAGTQTVTVTVQKHPIPTAQISIFLFHDNFPINGAPDLPEEENPAPGDPGHIDWSNFSLFLEEPAGRYGIAGGQVIQDAFGNPLGTTYLKTCDPNGNADGDPATNFACLDGDGAPVILVEGDGTMHPDENGFLSVQNLVPGKYGVIIIPPTGSNWQQTSTIEGTKVIDAWVKANEPPVFVEFGPPGPHVFVGFIKSTANGGFDPLVGGTTTVSGKIVDTHLSRPPATTFFPGRDFPGCWIGLNDATPGNGAGLYAAPCAADSTFEIPNVSAGNYDLVVFDANLDIIIAQLAFSVDDTGGTCNNGLSCDFGKYAGDPVGVFNWFTRLNAAIFNDDNQNGFWDLGEIGIGPESQDVSLRWRDGTIYQNFPTDNEGFAPFDETFPFFHWQVAEVSFANKKATGVTYVVDAGGEVLPDNGWTTPTFDELTPQPQFCTDAQSNDPEGADFGCTVGAALINPNTGNNLSRTEVGPSLTTGFQGFQGQTSVMQFGKTDYKTFDFSTNPFTFVGENGGISGIVYYSTTRAENEPQFAAAEEWEPGIPRVQVNLYADGDIDSYPLGDFPGGYGDVDWDGDGVIDGDDNVIDDVDGDGVVTLADIDNYPLGFSECADRDGDNLGDAGCTTAFGPEDIDRDGDGFFDFGDAVQVTWTDSWDDSLPTGCQGETFFKFGNPGLPTDCYDGLRNFNQIRPAVFDGGYAFADYDLDRLAEVRDGVTATAIQAFYDHVNTTLTANSVPYVDKLQLGLLPGDYIVESATPPGYEHIKEEDRNVDFGDEFIPPPDPEALPVACVGDTHNVPQYFSFLTKDGSGDAAQLIDVANVNDPGAFAPFALQPRPLCDRKKVPLSSGQNAAAEFFLMTDVPVMANVSGLTLNDLANEFDPNAPAFSEKFAPPWLPIGFYDWNGAPLNRVYGDQYGRFNATLSSTFTANVGMPSGMSPNMALACMNDPGPVPNGSGGFMLDPFYDPQYSQFCYTLQYMPGTITYLDTPVVSTAAFAGNGGFPVDCARPVGTPMVASVTLINGDGPFVVGGQPQAIRITSMGMVSVLNPEWDGTTGTPKNVQRNYGFGTQGSNGKVELEASNGTRYALTNVTWSDLTIDATVPASVPLGEYQVVVTADHTPPLVQNPLAESPMGVTLTVGTATYLANNVHTVPGDFATIQAAIDAAAAGDLILVAPGEYDELVIMWKPVKLQGWGPGSVFINARPIPTEKVVAWQAKAQGLVDDGSITPLPAQPTAPFGFAGLVGGVFPTEEGAGILVAGSRSGPGSFASNPGARIDGLTIVGSGQGGGIVVNGYAEDLQIGNNRITGNAGFFGGGIRVGHPLLSHTVVDTNDPSYDPAANGGAGNIGELVYDDGFNDNIRIHHNQIDRNGATGGAGGGISIHTGADDYRIQDNWICGNFTQGNGAGIGHLGHSDNGLIEDNFVIFNETFSQSSATMGGGIHIGGLAALEPDPETGLLLSPGAGNVTIDSNNIRGNLAGGGDGGGISIANVNGQDVADSLSDSGPWNAVNVFNNFINNNVTALAGGGITIQDSLKVSIRNNTVANNDSTATANVGGAFLPNLVNRSQPQPAGIVSREHSAVMAQLMNFEVTAGAGVPTNWLAFSDPVLRDDIILHNRSFYWANAATTTTAAGLFPSSCVDPAVAADPECDTATATLNSFSDDLAVMEGIAESGTYSLTPQDSLVTNTVADPGPGNLPGLADNGDFFNGYFNTDRRTTLLFAEPNTLGTAGAFDEGGNFLQVSYGPLSLIEPGAVPQTLFGYHLSGPSFAINNGGYNGGIARLDVDVDNEPRPPTPQLNDMGADERITVVPAAVDTDLDGVDDDVDNCPEVANADQRDTDGDGFGNRCDTDLNNSGATNNVDLGLFRSVFGHPAPGVQPYTLVDHADFNGDGGVNNVDMGILRSFFGKPPGP